MMKPETMFYIALGTVVDNFGKSDAYRVYASTADYSAERNRYNRLSLKIKAKAIVEFDRTMDRLAKEHGYV